MEFKAPAQYGAPSSDAVQSSMAGRDERQLAELAARPHLVATAYIDDFAAEVADRATTILAGNSIAAPAEDEPS